VKLNYICVPLSFSMTWKSSFSFTTVTCKVQGFDYVVSCETCEVFFASHVSFLQYGINKTQLLYLYFVKLDLKEVFIEAFIISSLELHLLSLMFQPVLDLLIICSCLFVRCTFRNKIYWFVAIFRNKIVIGHFLQTENCLHKNENG
jgi:hypothetical protein